MSDNHTNTNLWLGAGGCTPGVHTVGLDVPPEGTDASWPLPASVYTIDIDLPGNILACGTRAGTIHLLPTNGAVDGHKPAESIRLLAGGAVTSLCLATGGDLISANETGRVLHWSGQGENGGRPVRWDSGVAAVCLLGSTGRHVVGLGHDGQVVVWSECCGTPEARLFGPPPSHPIALARLATLTLEDRSAIVYSAQDGQLVMIQIDTLSLVTAAAHEGRWYAAFQVEDHLVTIGHDDGLMKFWRWVDGGLECAEQRWAFHGIVDAEVFPTDSSKGVAVLSNGRAVRFSMLPDSLAAEEAFPGECYRVVAAPCAWQRRELEAQQCRARVDELQDWIATSIDSDDDADLADSFFELESLGRRDASLALRAHQAMRAGDRLSELRLRHELADLLPNGTPDTLPYLERYGALLLEFAQYELALDVMNRIGDLGLTSSLSCQPHWLSAVVDAMRAGQEVVFAGADRTEQIADVISASRIVGRELPALWELHRSHAVLLPDVEVSASELAQTMKKLHGNALDNLVNIVTGPVAWVEKTGLERIEVIGMAPLPATRCKGLKVLLRLEPVQAGTVLTRSILLDMRMNQAAGDELQDCEELLRIVSTVKDRAGRVAVFAPINDLVRKTLQHLRSATATQCPSYVGSAL